MSISVNAINMDGCKFFAPVFELTQGQGEQKTVNAIIKNNFIYHNNVFY